MYKSGRRSWWYRQSPGQVDLAPISTRRSPRGHYALCGFRHSQKDHQFLREAGGWIGVSEGVVKATRKDLDRWMATIPRPWMAAMEATIFTSWVYDHLLPHAAAVKLAHPLMLRAITAAKRKNDRIDAGKIADLLRANLLPVCYMSPQEIRDLRRCLRYRNLLVRQSTQTKNKVSGLLMESGIEYSKQKLHQKAYFSELLKRKGEEQLPPSLTPLLKLSRTTIETTRKMERQILRGIEQDPLVAERIQRLMTIPGVGQVTAITWALETGEPGRFGSVKQAVSYCGLCGAEDSSAGKQKRTPISTSPSAP